jgi:hypothetical protein
MTHFGTKPTLRPCLVPLVAALLNKKKHKRHQTQNLFATGSRRAYATLHKSIDKRAAARDLLLVACALVLPSPLLRWMDRNPASAWPSSFRSGLPHLSSAASTLATIVRFPSGLLRPPPRSTPAACRRTALGSPPRTHASLLA